MAEPIPAFPARPGAQGPSPKMAEPRAAFGGEDRPRPAAPVVHREPAPLFAARATARPAALVLADQRLEGAEPGTRRKVKEHVVALDAVPADAFGEVAKFGHEVQAQNDTLSRQVLDLARTPPSALLRHLGAIREHVVSVSATDLLDASIGAAVMRRFLPPQERLAAALQNVTTQREQAEKALAGLAGRQQQIEATARMETANRAALAEHILALDIVLQAKREAGAPQAHLNDLEERMNSLRTTTIVGANDAVQIDTLRTHTAHLATSAREILTNLIGLWQRQCAAAAALLEAKRVDDLTARENAARGLGGARTRLAEALDRVLQPQA